MRAWINDARQDRGLSQSEVARQVGIAQQMFSNIESGKRRPSPEVAQRIAQVLGFDWTLFYAELGEPQQRGA